MTRFISLKFLFLLILFVPITLQGQERGDFVEHHPAFSEIDQAFKEGEISSDERMLQKFYVVLSPDKVMDRFKPLSGNHRLKCLTPLIIEFENRKDELSLAARDEIQLLNEGSCGIPVTDLTHVSPSGRFIFHYTLEGEHAVPGHAYVEQAGLAADSSWNHMVGTLGFVDPVRLPVVDPYEIYFKDFGPYGVTCSSGSSTYIVIHSNFEGFPPNQHQNNQLGALFATLAHEFKHASQYATNRWRGEAGQTNWVEMDAVMMEEVVFDDVNDYYHYIKSGGLNSTTPDNLSIFGSPENPIPGSYEHATWMLYFTEYLGIDFWVDVWTLFVREPLKPVLSAVKQILAQYEGDFSEHHTRSLTWHLGSGPDSGSLNSGFDERIHYPIPDYVHTFLTVPDSISTSDDLDPLAANFIKVRPSLSTEGLVNVSLNQHQPGLGLGLIAYFKDGRIRMDLLSDDQGRTEIQTLWTWNEIDELGIAVVNYNEDTSTSYQLIIDNPVSQQITLSRNYPNPFNGSTWIQFGVGQPRHIRIDVFDILGRHIQTLRDQLYEPGTHTIEFNGNGLSSGHYIFRLVSDGDVRSQEMVLIK